MLSLVGRNGMGKTTLCKAIVGLIPIASGSIRFMGEELVGRSPAEIARLGLGYVPQGRRLWPSLTVDEHLRLAAGNGRSQWTIPRIYEAFPRLAERRTNRGNQLSGGEQQMLAIARALPAQSAAPHHGRADRGPGAGHRRAGRGDPAQSRRTGRHRRARRRAEHRGRDRSRRERRDHDQRPGQPDHGRGAARGRPRAATAPARRRPAWRGGAGRRGAPRRRARGGRAPAAEGARPGPRLPVKSGDADALVAAGARRPDRNRRAHAHHRARAERGGHGAGNRSAADASRRRGAGHRRRNARHQRRRAALHSRPDRRRRRARHPGRSFDLRRAVAGGRAAAPCRHLFPRRAQRGLHRRTRRRDHRDGGSVRGLGPAAGTGRRPHFRGRIGRQLAGRAGDAGAADRRAQGPHLLGRLRQCRALCRPLRHHDALFGDRRRRPQFGVTPGSRQRGRGDGRHGEGARRRAGSAIDRRRGAATASRRSASPCSA